MIKLIDLLRESLNEILELTDPYDYTDNGMDDDGNVFYSFSTPKHKYSVGITPHEKDVYELNFNTAGEMGMDTNEGVVSKVLSTVYAIASEFIKKYEPAELIFRPIKTKGEDDERRKKAYKMFITKNKLKAPGYRMFDMGYTIRFVKEKPNAQ
jgi:hypothetical protein